MPSAAVDVKPLRAFGFPPDAVQDADLERWLTERFSFAAEPPYVLQQRQGGPCGVLAAVQAQLIARLLFGPGSGDGDMALSAITAGAARRELPHALAAILWRARRAGDGNAGDGNTGKAAVCSGRAADDDVRVRWCASEAEAAEMLAERLDAAYMEAGGVMLFMYSLMLTRSLAQLRADMDDATQGLTGQFGHCTQELMNLLLCGVAASQVFDGTTDMGGGMRLRGVPSRPQIGYLTHLEALRYCQVGSFYKKPRLPVWVMGSDSHYTVLFGRDRSINEESERQAALARAKRAFNAQDSQENGFVPIEKLADVVRDLGLALEEAELAQLVSACEMPGSGLALWPRFWAEIKPRLVPAREWNCAACTFLNAKEAGACEMCGAKRRDDQVDDNGEDEDNDDPHTLQLVHVNGLVSRRQGQARGPTVTPFSLTVVSKDLQAPSTHGLGEPIEETLHTRWPGSVFAWPDDRAANMNG